MKVKFCGLSRLEDIAAVNRVQPDYIGFVFVPASRRYVDEEKARELKACLDPSIRAVGVFVDEDPQMIIQLLESGVIDLAQLHGSESEEEIRTIQPYGEVIKAFKVKGKADLEKAQASPADYILLDGPAPGSGTGFDWNLLKGFRRPYFLAGGIGPNNIEEAIALQPWALDLSSGLECAGKKEESLMRVVMAALERNRNE